MMLLFLVDSKKMLSWGGRTSADRDKLEPELHHPRWIKGAASLSHQPPKLGISSNFPLGQERNK
jgi:hypothetical protein